MYDYRFCGHLYNVRRVRTVKLGAEKLREIIIDKHCR
jgi:hypothetical protein